MKKKIRPSMREAERGADGRSLVGVSRLADTPVALQFFRIYKYFYKAKLLPTVVSASPATGKCFCKNNIK
ncbi:hypothetical protein [Mucilaginibacter ginsenosidivorax]|uniref:Uncharacterized protein n=1 Tax=Mucilaginibacter ginsenosidivorax TaxID=862126 RepID=A0A5B8W2K2_9SPHI|nr:hypothetical protein [Mucilaginibacter ginsenosidivorax]QEC77729.1 hypothetical protein FSB76_17930 [Mucilaginibacter ginsenosidivorax]